MTTEMVTTATTATTAMMFKAAVTDYSALPHEPAGAAEAHTAQAHAIQRMEESLDITAHELRSPLTSSTLAIQLASRLLYGMLAHASADDDTLSAQLEPLHELLMQAASSLDQLNRLVGDLADVSRIRTGTLALHPAPCDLAAVVREVVEEQRKLVPHRAIRLRMPARPFAPLLADSDRVRQVVTNYLTNALRYTPADQPINVRIQRRPRCMYVSVRDEGPGVPRDQRQRIWKRFHRAGGTPVVADAAGGNAQTVPGLGLGLGLHICKSIVERHGGKVGLRSARGRGSIFWFTLPMVRSDG